MRCYMVHYLSLSLYVHRTQSTHISAIFFSLRKSNRRSWAKKNITYARWDVRMKPMIWCCWRRVCIYIECARLKPSLKWWAKILFLSPFVRTGVCTRCASHIGFYWNRKCSYWVFVVQRLPFLRRYSNRKHATSTDCWLVEVTNKY